MNIFQGSGFKAGVREPVEPNMKEYQQNAHKNVRTFKKLLEFYVYIIKSNNFKSSYFYVHILIFITLSHVTMQCTVRIAI
jgi:hypothetical protein